MLQLLRFLNYRCFADHSLPIKAETIVVGRNNAGKSTIIEGLRLVSLVTERYARLPFRDAPEWLERYGEPVGVRIDFAGVGISWENLFHRYQPPPAKVEARFHTGETIAIYLGPDQDVHATLRDSRGRLVTNRQLAQAIRFPRIGVLPQVAPLDRTEPRLQPGYVRANLASYLASKHFRNQLSLLREHFETFRTLAEHNWPGVRVLDLEYRFNDEGGHWELLIRDGDFVAEAAWMGHGLQMWLQTMWFLARTRD